MASLLTFASFTRPERATGVKDYFSLNGPIEFRDKKFSLSWSSHPSEIYYKQEYLPAGEQAESFHQMILIEALNGELAVTEALKGKTDELDQRKRMDPLVQYQVSVNKVKDEYLLDFIISQSNGNSSIVEWNVYRYIRLKLKSGKTGILLFGFSKRAYNEGTTVFLKNLKENRLKDMAAFTAVTVPAVSIEKRL